MITSLGREVGVLGLSVSLTSLSNFRADNMTVVKTKTRTNITLFRSVSKIAERDY